MWYVCETQSGREIQTAREISDELGVVAWCPEFVKRIVEKGKRRERTYALLPRYIFVESDAIQIVRPAVRGHRFVHDFLKYPDNWEPIAISAASIRVLRDVEADRNKVKRYGAGDWIRVVDGLRAGSRACILTVDSNGRLKVQEPGNVRPYSISRTSVEPIAGVTSGNPDRSIGSHNVAA